MQPSIPRDRDGAALPLHVDDDCDVITSVFVSLAMSFAMNDGDGI